MVKITSLLGKTNTSVRVIPFDSDPARVHLSLPDHILEIQAHAHRGPPVCTVLYLGGP
jgi:hypothetical protein